MPFKRPVVVSATTASFWPACHFRTGYEGWYINMCDCVVLVIIRC
jgi:hypothetical protein